MSTAELILGVTVLPAATLSWLWIISAYDAKLARIAACKHDHYEKYLPHLTSWKRYCHKCEYQDDITAEKFAEERRRDDLDKR